jgi:hypothetical protein
MTGILRNFGLQSGYPIKTVRPSQHMSKGGRITSGSRRKVLIISQPERTDFKQLALYFVFLERAIVIYHHGDLLPAVKAP